MPITLCVSLLREGNDIKEKNCNRTSKSSRLSLIQNKNTCLHLQAKTAENVICSYVIPMLGKKLEILNIEILKLTLNMSHLWNRSFIYKVK